MQEDGKSDEKFLSIAPELLEKDGVEDEAGSYQGFVHTHIPFIHFEQASLSFTP